jgi:hypothetical protein
MVQILEAPEAEATTEIPTTNDQIHQEQPKDLRQQQREKEKGKEPVVRPMSTVRLVW